MNKSHIDEVPPQLLGEKVGLLLCGQQSQVVSLSEQHHTKANSKTQTKPECLGTAEQRDKTSSSTV